MKTKTIIDLDAALAHHNSANGDSMTQKDLADVLNTSEAKLSGWKTKAPQVAADILKIKEATGAPLDIIIKEVAV